MAENHMQENHMNGVSTTKDEENHVHKERTSQSKDQNKKVSFELESSQGTNDQSDTDQPSFNTIVPIIKKLLETHEDPLLAKNYSDISNYEKFTQEFEYELNVVNEAISSLTVDEALLDSQQTIDMDMDKFLAEFVNTAKLAQSTVDGKLSKLKEIFKYTKEQLEESYQKLQKFLAVEEDTSAHFDDKMKLIMMLQGMTDDLLHKMEYNHATVNQINNNISISIENSHWRPVSSKVHLIH